MKNSKKYDAISWRFEKEGKYKPRTQILANNSGFMA
jgi:hypothetical protein